MNKKNIVKEKIKGNEILGNLKNAGILSLVVVGIVLMLSGSVNAYKIRRGICKGNSCNDCSNALNNSSCSVVKLTHGITNYTYTFIGDSANFTNLIYLKYICIKK